jgi:predicted polyphosphate/ATP-dependent NAD kinase
MDTKVIGLVVNPVAGMGGSVGLKGTDGREMYVKALELGAEPVTPRRTIEFLAHIKHLDRIHLLVASGVMGAVYIQGFDLQATIIGEVGEKTSPADTKRIARQMVELGAGLLVFVGGDGTARDIYDAIGSRIPVVAVPAGVKVFSSVFAVSARAAAEMVDAYIEGTGFGDEEVLDIDEEAYREDRLSSRLYGYLVVPEVRGRLQTGKAASDTTLPSRMVKKEIAEYIVSEMDNKTLYLLGPGTTVKAIADELGLPKTLLGVDAVYSRQLVEKDLNERGILRLFERYDKRMIVVTPIGGNGFIFGRGSKQFTPQVIKQVGKENILVVGTRDKIDALDCLRVDTGEFELDQTLSGYLTVWIGDSRAIAMKVGC